jgi:hypothetical protein
MTTNDAAAVLEHIVEKRGAEWVATNWGLDREQLARWYEGQEELPPEMVFAMRVWVSAVRKPKGDVGCFEDRDHPCEVPEDVIETGLDAVPMPTVGRGEALWDAYRLETRQFHATELTDLEDFAWQEAGEQCDLIEALDQYEWLPEIMPVTAWDKDLNWQSLIRVLADYVRSAIEVRCDMKDISRGALLWEGYRFVVGPPNDSELVEMVEAAWEAAGARYDVDVVGDYNWLMGEFPLDNWPKHLPWERLVDWLRGHICDLLGR